MSQTFPDWGIPFVSMNALHPSDVTNRAQSSQRESVEQPCITAWCRENMATYKVPEIRLVDTLPMTATGKVKRADLAKLL